MPAPESADVHELAKFQRRRRFAECNTMLCTSRMPFRGMNLFELAFRATRNDAMYIARRVRRQSADVRPQFSWYWSVSRRIAIAHTYRQSISFLDYGFGAERSFERSGAMFENGINHVYSLLHIFILEIQPIIIFKQKVVS